MDSVQGCPGTSEVGVQVGHGQPEVVHGFAQNSQGYDPGCVLRSSAFVRGRNLCRRDVGQVGSPDNDRPSVLRRWEARLPRRTRWRSASRL